MWKTDNVVFKALYIVAWMIFIGLCVEAGGLVVNFFFSMFKPEFIPNLYQKLDLTHLYPSNGTAFFGAYSFILTIAILKAVLFYQLILLMHKMDLLKPFNTYVANKIVHISYYTLSIGFLSYIGRQFIQTLLHRDLVIENLSAFWADSQAFVLMGAVI